MIKCPICKNTQGFVVGTCCNCGNNKIDDTKDNNEIPKYRKKKPSKSKSASKSDNKHKYDD